MKGRRGTSGSWLAHPAVLSMACLCVLSAPEAAAQLRPFSPIDWASLEHPRPVSIGLGMGTLRNQPASLAGTRGDLLELGTFHVTWVSGRFEVEAQGTFHRRFDDDGVMRPPVPGTDPPNGTTRTDAGDVVASTTIRLTQAANRFTAALRFGTRLPTASNEPGLERDRTDFFASFGGRYRFGRLALGAEAGVGILGTRDDGLDQLDVLTFAAVAEVRVARIIATGSVVGHDDLRIRVIRGNEDLSEIRLGLRTGDRVWVSATAVRGIADFSPGVGFFLMVGIRR